MILDQIKQQQCERWYLDEILYDRLVYRTNLMSDPFAAIEVVLKKGDPNKAIKVFEESFEF